jgi:hypothetical protein
VLKIFAPHVPKAKALLDAPVEPHGHDHAPAKAHQDSEEDGSEDEDGHG